MWATNAPIAKYFQSISSYIHKNRFHLGAYNYATCITWQHLHRYLQVYMEVLTQLDLSPSQG